MASIATQLKHARISQVEFPVVLSGLFNVSFNIAAVSAFVAFEK